MVLTDPSGAHETTTSDAAGPLGVLQQDCLRLFDK